MSNQFLKFAGLSFIVSMLVSSSSSFGFEPMENLTGNIKAHINAGEHNIISKTPSTAERSLLVTSRLNYLNWITEKTFFDFSYDFSVQMAKREPAGDYKKPLSYRIYDLGSISDDYLGEYAYMAQNLDRALIGLNFEKSELILGRQAVSFGAARFTNPTDIFLPFPIGKVDSEYRTGIDAIRYRYSVSEFIEAEYGYVFGDKADAEKNASFVSLTAPVGDWDLETLAVSYRENFLVGLSLQGDIFSQGVWLEAASVDLRDDKDNSGIDKFNRISLGLDSKFSDETILTSEYHFNGAGQKESEDYALNYSSLAYTESGVFFNAHGQFEL